MKKILAISLALSLVLAIASCGGDDTATSSAATSSTATSSTATSSATESVAAPSVVSTPSVEVTSSEAPVEDGPVNLALNGEAFDDEHGGYQSAEKVPAQAIDGNTATAWQYADNVGEGTLEFEDGVYLGVTFEAATVESVTIVFENAARADEYEIQYTTDGEDWEEIEDAEIESTTGTGEPKLDTDVATFEAIEDVTGIRVVMYKSNGKYAPQIFELEVYGTVGAADADTETDADAETETDAE